MLALSSIRAKRRQSEEEGLGHNQPEVKVTYLAFATAFAAREQKFIVAVVPQPAGGESC